uniref:Cytochrome p450 CYP367A1 n=1 Tax=Spodoptera exigua TaxID=7107 RepID=A0A248QHM1_SPOEX|nr:cytochrome p450 CYP367A1 [Spodoptera exigua]
MNWLLAVLYVVGGALSASWLVWRYKRRRMLEMASKLPGPTALPLLGNTFVFMSRPEETVNKLEELMQKYGEIYRFWLGPELNIVVRNPAYIRSLLSSTKVNQKGPVYDFMVPFIGSGILSGGPTWRSHRKIVILSYNKKSVENYFPVFNKECEELAKVISQKEPVTFDCYKDILRSTTQGVNQTLMGLSKEDSEQVYRLEEIIFKTHDMYTLIFNKMTKWWLQVPLIYWLLGKKKQHDYYLKLIDDVMEDIVRRRKKALEVSKPDEECMGVVDRLILSGELTDMEIKEETMTLFTSSQEVAAKIAAGVLMFLAHLPEWQDKVYQEIIDVVGPDGPVTNEQLKLLENLDMVYKETLRYFPIGAMIQRTVIEDISIKDGSITIPAGTSLVIPIHSLNRDPRYWEHPNKVMPERFLPENVEKRDPNAFIPFSLGPMDCLGRTYGTALIKTLVVWVLRYAKLEPAVSLDNIQLDIAISVTSFHGYNIKARPRNGRINGLS